MRLSIMMPAVFDRDSRELASKLVHQIGNLPVELLVLSDNRKRSTGLKRQALLDMAQGEYVMCLDDDDSLADDAIPEIMLGIYHEADLGYGADVISFNSRVTIEGGNPFTVRTGMAFENQQCSIIDDKWQDITRKPWHWCAWKRAVARTATFPDGYIDDDAFWLKQLWRMSPSEHHIDKALHRYCFNSRTSLSHQGKPTVE